ncbi:MAG: glycosyltransferase family 4 protein [Chloroflexi bacterium]|nr:glycosyltransferase family 4 protein [Chloroflexota bacterium]
MKILFGIHHFPPHYRGGAELETHRRALALQAHGYDVQVICVEKIDRGPKEGVSWVDEVYEGVKVRRLSFNMAATPDPFLWEYDNPWIGDHLRQLMLDYQPDIFYLVSGYLMSGRALLVARELGIPTVVMLTDFWFLCRRITLLRSNGQLTTMPIDPMNCARCLGEEKRRYRWPAKLVPGLMDSFWRLQKHKRIRFEARARFLLETLGQANCVISPSNFLRLAHIEAGLPADKIIFSRQGRDFPGLTEAMLEKKPSGALRVGYLGQIAHLKGVHVLLEAVKQLPQMPIEVQVYGDLKHFPGYVAKLRRLIGDDSRFHLNGLYDQLTNALHELDVVVAPSLWYENSPNVILEALAHCTPVLASNLGGMAELVQDGRNGLLFKAGDAGDLARQLRRLLDEPGLLPKLRAGIQPVKTVAEELDELKSICQELLAGKSRPASEISG